MTLDDKQELLLEFLAQLPDPREERGVRYKLRDLILLTLYASLAGQYDAVSITYFVEIHFEYFKELIGLKRVPSHDTISRILALIDYNQLAKTLSEWLAIAYPELCIRINGNKVLHIDGKAVRAAAKHSDGERSVYIMNAMYEGGSISLNCEKVGEKENEISTMSRFLDMFNIENTIVTMDGMGANKTVLDDIVRRNGYYNVPIKNSNTKIKQAIDKEVNRLKTTKKNETETMFDTLSKCSYISREHGREETYSASLIDDTRFIYETLGNEGFYGTIAKICLIEKETKQKVNGVIKTTHSSVYTITNLESISVKNMLALKLGHWNVEMQHWLLDVQLNEDRMTARRGNATINNSILKRFCMRIKKEYIKDSKITLNKFTFKNSVTPNSITDLLFNIIAK